MLEPPPRVPDFPSRETLVQEVPRELENVRIDELREAHREELLARDVEISLVDRIDSLIAVVASDDRDPVGERLEDLAREILGSFAFDVLRMQRGVDLLELTRSLLEVLVCLGQRSRRTPLRGRHPHSEQPRHCE